LYKRLSAYQSRFVNIQNQIDSMITLLEKQIRHRIDNVLTKIDYDMDMIDHRIRYRLNEASLSYKRFNTLLEAYNSQNVLKRGYTMVLQDDKVVKSKANLKNEEFEVRFSDGSIKAIQR
ncbi:MAG: hypothetical protein J6Z03_07135, partial [Erysipelotrichaceae bacterium]|nr:hypothetical protein [Erysipelotrichaceae bacterium]